MIKKYNGFSLAELMIVMLVLSIILAATMPILSKRAKVRAAAAAGASGTVKACTTVVTNARLSVNIPSDVKFLVYTLYGGGGGGGGYSSGGAASSTPGGGGGVTVLAIDGKKTAGANGGMGGNGDGIGSNGAISQGMLILNPSSATHTLNVFPGGGGGGGGTDCGSGGGGIGAGKGSATGSYGGDGGTLAELSTTTDYAGTSGLGTLNATQGISPGFCSTGYGRGATTTDGITVTPGAAPSINKSGGSGGGFGGKGGDGGTASTAGKAGNNGTSTQSYGAGGAGGTSTTASTGGSGGSATIFYFTTAATCPF